MSIKQRKEYRYGIKNKKKTRLRSNTVTVEATSCIEIGVKFCLLRVREGAEGGAQVLFLWLGS